MFSDFFIQLIAVAELFVYNQYCPVKMTFFFCLDTKDTKETKNQDSI